MNSPINFKKNDVVVIINPKRSWLFDYNVSKMHGEIGIIVRPVPNSTVYETIHNSPSLGITAIYYIQESEMQKIGVL